MLRYTLLIFLMAIATSQSNECLNYLSKLQQQLIIDPHLFMSSIAPYLLYSGKDVDDLGYAGTCINFPTNAYTTVQLQLIINDNPYTGYMGLCFSSNCSAADLNLQGHFIVDYILENLGTNVTSKFVDPPMNLQFSPLALTVCLVFTLFCMIGMLAPMKRWIEMCKASDDEQYVIQTMYVNIDNSETEYEEPIDVDPIIQRVSLRQKWKNIWKDEESTKIYSFSLFKVLIVPLIIYGQLFYQTNHAAYNITAFADTIYPQFYAKIAQLIYYVPDVMFMISGFLFCVKATNIKQDQNAYLQILYAIGNKLLRLYPMYLTVMMVYWCVTPALHCGPVWYVYQQQVLVCNTSWWKALLMIDNWFQESCYPMLWFVQVQVQFVFFISIFYILYHTHKLTSYYYFAIIFLSSFVLMFVLSAQFPVSLTIVLDDYTQLYFRSFYSHLWPYLWGVFLGLLHNNSSLKLLIEQHILEKASSLVTVTLISFTLFLLILLRPSIWWSTQSALSLQLAASRTGIVFTFTMFFLNGMFRYNRKPHKTVLHKYSYYTYPMILFSYLVMQGSFWSVSSFFYVTGISLLNMTISLSLVTGVLGILVGLLMDGRGLIKPDSYS